MINARLVPAAQAAITPGEAMAGIMLRGLGFAHRRWSLTPLFFASQPLDLLGRAGMRAEMFHRFKLGCTLDKIYTYGCDLLFPELALTVCAQEGLDLRGNHLDPTSFSRSGEDVPERDAHAITLTPWLLQRSPAGLAAGGVGTHGVARWGPPLSEQRRGRHPRTPGCSRSGRRP